MTTDVEAGKEVADGMLPLHEQTEENRVPVQSEAYAGMDLDEVVVTALF